MQEQIQFGTDGIRGIAGIYPLSPEAVLAISRAVGNWLNSQYQTSQVIIGRDTRPSGMHLTHTLIAGLTAEGIAVDDAGVISTPGIAHLARSQGYHLGIVISASHNPFNQNGIKIIGGDGFKLSDADQTAIEALIPGYLDTPAAMPPAQSFGAVNQVETYREHYMQHLTADLRPDALAGLSVVLDCANGAAYSIAPTVFARLGATVTALGASPTGHNINVHSGSEHVRRHSQTLQVMMADVGAQLGIAFDGDADRVIFLTPDGTLIDGDYILGLLAVQRKKAGQLPGDTVVATTMSNSGLAYYLEQHGIALERTKVGDRYVMERMRAGGFPLGGEQAGHIILLDDDHTAGDGIYVGLQVAALVAQDHDLLQTIAQELPKFPQVIASIHLENRIPLEQVSALQSTIEQTLAAFDHQGRVDMRYSGTEPNLLRAMVEGGLKTSMDEVIQHALNLGGLVVQASGTASPRYDMVNCATGAKIDLATYL